MLPILLTWCCSADVHDSPSRLCERGLQEAAKRQGMTFTNQKKTGRKAEAKPVKQNMPIQRLKLLLELQVWCQKL